MSVKHVPTSEEVIEALSSALARTQHNFDLAVRGKPVSDMAENLAENFRAFGLQADLEEMESTHTNHKPVKHAFTAKDNGDGSTAIKCTCGWESTIDA